MPQDTANSPASSAADLEALLGPSAKAGPSRRRWVVARGVGLGIVALVAAVLLFRSMAPPPPAQFVTTPARRGDLVVSVLATGSLTPVNQVDVGSEVSGTVDSVLADDNDKVRKGQVLATLDTSRLRDQIALGEGAVAAAQANLRQSQATVTETGLRAGRLNRLYQISKGGYPARADVDAADAALARARAAAAASSAGVAQARANLNTSRTNLSKATIRSPISGVVLTRKIEPGQTVAAALQAPVLFTLAEDMTRMELLVDIDEADVGKVADGQAAVFTVDAYPGRSYPARVTRVGLGSKTTEGVVTYTGVLAVTNADLSLRPGMTAAAEMTTSRRTGVLLVPDAALRFTPPETRAKGAASVTSALVPRMPRMGGRPTRRSTDSAAQQVWVLREGVPVRVAVRVGASDGRDTEVTGGDLKAGMAVITETAAAAK
ncbi:MAG: efflux RND transporter periplasmic adaptor subunit [Phenylobacterium sp.]|uniref:efflux RND transporter periplasmic adaptor subunit n=1 Tax=Phenylobacterium sp. TaxID=1871053 RepID=UPI0027232AD1|nr:efflux RND transporter periplasmic adaptor subunit [Phenylobacterium sp.]MDO8913879.1 efflux RND transporter periplasmic adaptor subunit [Phenylobacterium sp.]MDP3100438.1 efflux RND transporter periplasmic adaptor subunit [Phenylobacterium sp.]